MKKLVKQTSKILSLILGIFLFLGCGSDDAAIEIPKVVAGFTSTINADTGTATFTNTSTNATNYAWNFGDGNTSTEKNPAKNYSSGTFTVSLTASNNAGASDTFTDELTITLPETGAIIMLPITFDDAAVDYTATAFNGTAFTVVENPAPGGTNSVASKVGSIVNIGAEFEGFFFELGEAIDLSTDKSITMNFWSDAAVAVLVKLEEGNAFSEATANHGGTGWEALTVDFPSALSYSTLTIFANATGTEAGTYYIDDIKQVATDGPSDCIAETEESLNATDFNLTFQNELTGLIESFDAGLSRVANPDADNEVNSSCFVGKIDRTAAEYANNQIRFDSKFDFSAYAGFKMKVWSPTVGTNVLLKLEDQADAGSFVELTAVTTTAGAWEELTFPVSLGENGKYDFIILFFELATFTAETYYIDDLALFAREGDGGGDGAEGDLTINGSFETGDDTGWTPFLNGGAYMVTDSEAACGSFSGNLAAGEGQSPLIKQSAIGIGTVTPNTEITISFDLRGSVAGEGGVVFAELFSETTGAGPSKAEILNNNQPLFPTDTWTRYTFTTTTGPDVEGGITLQLAAICGAEVGCGVDAYFDNVFVSLGTTGGVNCGNTEPGNGGDGGTGVGAEFSTNGDFETGDLSGWTLFVDPAGASFTASNAQASGGTFSGNLVSDFDAGNGAAVDAVVKQANLGVGTVLPNTDYVVSFDLRGSLTGIGGVFFAEFFSELDGGGTSSAEILSGAPLPLTNTWNTFNFTVTTGADVSGGITLQMKTSSGTSAGTVVDAYFDNVSIKLAE